MSVISKKSFLNKADKQQSNWEQTTGQEAGGVLNKQDFIRQAKSAAQQRQAQGQKPAQQRQDQAQEEKKTRSSVPVSGMVSEQEYSRSPAMQQQYGTYENYLRGVEAVQGRQDGTQALQKQSARLAAQFAPAAQRVREDVYAYNAAAAAQKRQQQEAESRRASIAHDQLAGMKRTLGVLEQQAQAQAAAEDAGFLAMLGKASDSTLPTFQADAAQSETDRRIQELQDEIDRQESESQMQGTKRPETYTAKNVGRYKDRLIALASVPGVWTKRQKQEAEEIIGTQSGFGGLLGYEQNVTAFAPYQEAMRKGDTEAAKQWQQIYDVLYTRLYSKQTAVASGLQEGLGVTSAAAAVGKLLGANEDEYHRQMENAQRAQAEHPVLAGGAKVAGSLALMSGIGEAAGAGLAAAGIAVLGLHLVIAPKRSTGQRLISAEDLDGRAIDPAKSYEIVTDGGIAEGMMGFDFSEGTGKVYFEDTLLELIEQEIEQRGTLILPQPKNITIL